MLLLFKNMEDRKVSHLNVYSKHYGKYQFLLKLIQLPTPGDLEYCFSNAPRRPRGLLLSFYFCTFINPIYSVLLLSLFGVPGN